MPRKRGSSASLASLGASLACAALLLGCDSLHGRTTGAAPSATRPSEAPTEHADDEHRSVGPRVVAPTAVALSSDARRRLTTLRISAHVGSVIVRKSGEDWTISGSTECVVRRERIEQALDNLTRLTAVSTDDRPGSGQEFELQIVVLMEQEPALHFDIAGRNGDADLVQLRDETTVRLLGLDRSLWSPQPRDWCALSAVP